MRTILATVALSCLVIGFFRLEHLSAQTTVVNQAEIAAQNAEIAKLEAEIARFKDELAKTQSQGQNLNSAVKELDLNQKKLEADTRLIEQKIKKANLEIGRLGDEINDKKDTISGLKTAVRSGIRRLEEGERTSFLIYLLREESMSEAFREFDSIRSIAEHLNHNIHTLAQATTELEDKRSDVEFEREEIVELKSSLDVQKKIIQANKSEKERLLKTTKNEESAYRKMIAESERKKEQFEAEIRKIEEGLSYDIDIKKLPIGKAFAWPLEKIIITQRFGKTASSGRLYKSGSHSGVDFGAPIGTPIYAMADGTVEGTGDTDVLCPRISYGRFVLIKYDNGLASTYAHLSVITAKKGDQVKRGQLVGYTGNTGYSTGPHLHVSVYARDAVNMKTLPSISCKGKILTQPIAATNAYLDPLKYLPEL